MASGGDIVEIFFQNDGVGSGTWFPVSEEAGTLDPGGPRSADPPKVDGGGNIIDVKNVKPWMFNTVISWDANVSNEVAKAAELAASIFPTTWTVTLANGTNWTGVGSFLGEIQGDTGAATLPIKVGGGGRMRKV